MTGTPDATAAAGMVLGFSPLDVLLVLGLGLLGFLVVALVCAMVLGVLQLVLPRADSGAEAADRPAAARARQEGHTSPPGEAPAGEEEGDTAANV